MLRLLSQLLIMIHAPKFQDYKVPQDLKIFQSLFVNPTKFRVNNVDWAKRPKGPIQ
jgi:hypothetical protein